MRSNDHFAVAREHDVFAHLNGPRGAGRRGSRGLVFEIRDICGTSFYRTGSGAIWRRINWSDIGGTSWTNREETGSELSRGVTAFGCSTLFVLLRSPLRVMRRAALEMRRRP